jgi:hypothetical protein
MHGQIHIKFARFSVSISNHTAVDSASFWQEMNWLEFRNHFYKNCLLNNGHLLLYFTIIIPRDSVEKPFVWEQIRCQYCMNFMTSLTRVTAEHTCPNSWSTLADLLSVWNGIFLHEVEVLRFGRRRCWRFKSSRICHRVPTAAASEISKNHRFFFFQSSNF